jgi:hypothetical protein
MARLGHALLLLAALAALSSAACKKSDTVLLVEVYGPIDIRPSQFNVTITAGLDTRAILVPANLGEAGIISLPASFSISLDQSHTGPITISVDAYDETGSTIAFGSTMQDHIVIGGQRLISVELQPALEPPTLDAGGGDARDGGGADTKDAPADTASPSDAPQDEADGMDLDAATD